jgi:hypothetical protein
MPPRSTLNKTTWLEATSDGAKESLSRTRYLPSFSATFWVSSRSSRVGGGRRRARPPPDLSGGASWDWPRLGSQFLGRSNRPRELGVTVGKALGVWAWTTPRPRRPRLERGGRAPAHGWWPVVRARPCARGLHVIDVWGVACGGQVDSPRSTSDHASYRMLLVASSVRRSVSTTLV